MTEKEKRMLKAARKRWQENKDLKTIADELNLAYKTVRNYFSGDKMQRFERFYSESDKQLLEQRLQQMVKDGTQTALDIRSDLQSDPEVDARVKSKVLKEAQKIPERHITMLQELGVIDKPKERKEVQETSGEIVFNEEVVTKEEKEDDDEEEEVVTE